MDDPLHDALPELSPPPPPPSPLPKDGQQAPDGQGSGTAADSLAEDGHPRSPAGKDQLGDANAFSYTSAAITSGIVAAGHIEMAGQVFKQQFNVTAGAGRIQPVPLSTRHFTARTSQELERCEEELICDPLQVGELSAAFEQTRILILAGEPEVGKGSLGLQLGARLSRSLGLRGMLSCQRLASGVQVDLEKVVDDATFGHQVVLFEDALAGDNSDLRAFCKSVDSLRLTTLKERLRKSASALLLTVSSAAVAEFERRLSGLGVLYPVAPPAPELLVQALHRFATNLTQQGPTKAAVLSFLAAHAVEAAHELRTVPRAARFVHEYLVDVVEAKMSLRHALGRMDDLSQWLTADLADDLDAQAAALAIVLGSAAPPAAGVPWFAYDQLRRRITELRRQELRLAADQPSSPRELGTAFLDRARATVAAMPAPQAPLVRFRDERDPGRLWQALVGPARDLATSLLPLLRELAEGPDAEPREIAAAALGRLGLLGPADLAVPLLRDWLGAEREEQLGLFLLGSANSGEEAYRDLCLATLRQRGREGGADQEVVAVRCLGALGLPDPAVPIGELCVVVQERLPIQFDLLRQVEAEIAHKERTIRRRIAPRQVTAMMRDLHETAHGLLMAILVPQDCIRLVAAVQYALVGVLLSQGGDPGPVLRQVLTRMRADKDNLAPLLACIFLHRHGVFDLLDRYKWTSGACSDKTSRFLLASRPGERDSQALRELLEAIFSALTSFPGLFRFLLEQRFLEILKAWSRDGCAATVLRPTVLRLLAALRAAPDVDLRRTMEHFLIADPDLVESGSRLRALAQDVRDGKDLDAAPVTLPRPRRLPSWLGKRQEAGE
jgi:hypothetical protein